MNGNGIGWEPRIYANYYSGRSDRVVAEWALEDLGEGCGIEPGNGNP